MACSWTLQYTSSTVCANAFISTHFKRKRRIERLCELLLASKRAEDNCGNKVKVNSAPGAVWEHIQSHIEPYPTKRHFSGKKIRYLNARLTVKQILSMFPEKCPDTKARNSLT